MTTVFPPGQISLFGAMTATENIDPYVAYVSPDKKTIFHLAGPMAPTPGAQNGVILQDGIKGLMAPFDHLGTQGARQDGKTWQDAVYDAAEYDFNCELTGVTPQEARMVVRRWIGAWDAKKRGKLCWFTPEMGEWWANVRMFRTIPDTLNHVRHARQVFTWTAQNDDAFWESWDSVSTFGGPLENGTQTVTLSSGVTSGTFILGFNLIPTSLLNWNATPLQVQTALQVIPGIGPGNVSVTGANGGPYTVTFVGALAGLAQPKLTALEFLFGGSLFPTVTVDVLKVGGGKNGFLPLSNRGDQDAWPRYLVSGPGVFAFSDGVAGSQITFGPLLDGQRVLITTEPRLRSVVDLTPNQTFEQPLDEFQLLIRDLISFATNYNVPPLLQQFESLFGILPPQGVLYSLLTGRFTKPIAPKVEGSPPVTSHIGVAIARGNSHSGVIAAITPRRRWPE